MTNFDFIIIGAGSAGCVLANRLSANPDCNVLVLEAGGPDKDWLIHIPIGVGKILPEQLYNWNYLSAPEPHVDNRKIYHPRGKVLGGSSSINIMAYVRGHAGDYDRWRQMGLSGWGYDDVLPYFKKAEGFDKGGDFYHGGDGPLGVSSPGITDPLYQTFAEAGQQAGYPYTDDYNGAEQEGFSPLQFTTRNGKRSSAAVAYLHPASGRPNLSITTRAHVTRILFEGQKAIGVEYIRGGKIQKTYADREVIVSGGAYNSPQTLLLSGIGPADHLNEIGIKPIADVKGVGQNLQDHPSNVLVFSHKGRSRFVENLRYDRLALSMIRAQFFGSGFATENPSQVTAFLKSDPAVELPDTQFFCRSAPPDVKPWFPLFRKAASNTFVIRTCQLRPESRGFVELGSDDPMAPAKIQNNFLQTETDRRVLRDCVKMTRDIVSQSAFEGLRGAELVPGESVKTDDEIDAFVRQNLSTVFHPLGTCKMGIDEEAVVDPDLKVRGVQGLRVVDASVMPDLVGGNINAPVIMIAEKAADIILGAAKA